MGDADTNETIIRTWRKEAGYTLADVADQLHFNVEHISRLETRKRNITLNTAMDICAFYRKDLNELVAGLFPDDAYNLYNRFANDSKEEE